MASNMSTVQFIAEQIAGAGEITIKKMFGEFLIYCNSKPIFLICDDTLYVKILPETEKLTKNGETGYPYSGAKLHYIIEDIDDSESLTKLALILESVIPLPKKKKKT